MIDVIAIIDLCERAKRLSQMEITDANSIGIDSELGEMDYCIRAARESIDELWREARSRMRPPLAAAQTPTSLEDLA